jgi:hypothetical protein
MLTLPNSPRRNWTILPISLKNTKFIILIFVVLWSKVFSFKISSTKVFLEREFFWFFKNLLYSTKLPLRFHCVGGYWDRTQKIQSCHLVYFQIKTTFGNILIVSCLLMSWTTSVLATTSSPRHLKISSTNLHSRQTKCYNSHLPLLERR